LSKFVTHPVSNIGNLWTVQKSQSNVTLSSNTDNSYLKSKQLRWKYLDKFETFSLLQNFHRFVTIVIKDVNDNEPKFPEEEDPGYFVGRVQAKDPDKDKNGRVYYYIVAGNEGRWFSVDKTYGNIYTKQKLDREERYFKSRPFFPRKLF